MLFVSTKFWVNLQKYPPLVPAKNSLLKINLAHLETPNWWCWWGGGGKEIEDIELFL